MNALPKPEDQDVIPGGWALLLGHRRSEARVVTGADLLTVVENLVKVLNLLPTAPKPTASRNVEVVPNDRPQPPKAIVVLPRQDGNDWSMQQGYDT